MDNKIEDINFDEIDDLNKRMNKFLNKRSIKRALKKYRIKDLEKENKELQERIDKAIKYIEENTQELEGITGYYYTIYDTEDLLKILKGDVDE